jgi:HSP20 family protein
MNELSILDSLFNDVFENRMPSFNYSKRMVTPKVDVTQSKDSYILEMDLPGRSENDVNLELDQNVLTISSVKETNEEKNLDKKDDSSDESKWIIKERHTSSFSRRFTLPDDIDSENVKATFKNGVLNITIPRKALAAPKRIAITA